jgi:hypothetical protein
MTAIIYVNIISSSGGDGTSWISAYNDLQNALASAFSGDQIWVAQGTYIPSQAYDVSTGSQVSANIPPTNATFYVPNGVKIYGGFDGTETSLNQRNFVTNTTILTGDLGGGSNVYHVVFFYQVGSNTQLDGFTITSGMANGTGLDKAGAGIFNNGAGINNVSNPTIQNCIIINNYSGNGSAVFNHGANGGVSSPSFVNCTFTNNNIFLTDNGNGGVTYNNATNTGISSPSFTNCKFLGNSSTNAGGAIFNFANDGVSSPSFISCVFSNNFSTNNGGAVYNNGTNNGISSPSFVTCLFANNYVTNGNGGAIFNNESTGTCSPTFMNVTFYNNSANTGSIIYDSGTITETIINSILWDTNTSSSANLIVSTNNVNITYSDITGGWPGTNNINIDPLFYNEQNLTGPDNIWATNDDGLTLQSNSPALSAGTKINAPTTDIIGNLIKTSLIGAYGASISPQACLHPNTRIKTQNGYTPICSINVNDYVYKANGKEIKVLYNIKFLSKNTDFIKISKGSLGNGLPFNDIHITKGHPLILNNREVLCGTLINNRTIKEIKMESTHVYAICASKRIGIMTEGIPILTWEKTEFEKFATKNNIVYTKL